MELIYILLLLIQYAILLPSQRGQMTPSSYMLHTLAALFLSTYLGLWSTNLT